MKKFIRATVIETGEQVKVDDIPADPGNPFGFYSSMWHSTSDGRVYHDDELKFIDKRLSLEALNS